MVSRKELLDIFIGDQISTALNESLREMSLDEEIEVCVKDCVIYFKHKSDECEKISREVKSQIVEKAFEKLNSFKG
jgi:hypothetical protein